jgi:hypothetical protein
MKDLSLQHWGWKNTIMRPASRAPVVTFKKSQRVAGAPQILSIMIYWT